MKARWLCGSVVILLALSAGWFVVCARAAEPALTTSEEVIGTILPQDDPDAVGAMDVVVSPDMRRVAYVLGRGEKKKQVTFFGTAVSASFVYPRSLVVVDGRPGEEYERVGRLAFSGDGRRFRYVATRGGVQRVVVDGVPGKEYQDVNIELCFCRDSKCVFYEARRDGKACVVVDGVEGKWHDEIRGARLSPDGRRVAYVARQGTRWFAVIDGAEGEGYDEVDPNLRWSPDSRRVAYTARRGGEQFLVLDGVEGKAYSYVGVPVFSPDSQRIAYQAAWGESRWESWEFQGMAMRSSVWSKNAMVIDGVEGTIYDGTSGLSPVFSADSKRVAYVAERGGKKLVVADGAEGKEYEDVWLLAFSPDSTRLAYVARREGKESLVMDSVEGKVYDRMWSYTFSTDGRHLAQKVNDGRKGLVVLDGAEGTPYTSCDEPAFSPGGAHVAYRAVASSEVLVVDGQEIKMGATPDQQRRLERMASDPHVVFADPSSVRTVVLRGNDVVRVTVSMQSGGKEPTSAP